MMLDPATRALMVVNATLMSETTPIEEFDIVAELVVMVETTEVTVTLPLSIE